MTINVAYSTYPVSGQFRGGGHVILESIYNETRKMKGIKAKKFDMWEDDLADFDVLHNFDVQNESLPLLEVAKSKGAKVALHPFFTYSLAQALREKIPAKQKLKMVGYNLVTKYNFLGLSCVQKEMRMADALFPNSEMEAAIMTKDFRIPREKVFVVPDGIDERFFHGNPKEFRDKFCLDDYVLFVGRIEPRKNVMRLARALKNEKIELAIVGPANPQDNYFNECKKEAGKNCHFLGGIPHDSSLLNSAFAGAKAFVLPSWDETPGLTALEAAASGTPLAITSGGCTREYFGNYAHYIEPGNEKSIRNAVLKALGEGRNAELREFVKKNYTWKIVAEKVVSAYKKIL
ncbi:MAG: glycosyltransferase family 4 protein [archaeon]